jgi:two-component system KDP operon response regulator KdpE
MKILVVEDDRKVAGFIEQGLREEGYVVDVAPDGDQGTMLAHVNDYDLLVLDVMLPKKTGLQVAAELRREGRATPILMLTARDTTEDVVRGLDAGADDYLTKPFGVPELLARLRVALRHEARLRAGDTASTLDVGGLHVDLGARRVTVDGREAQLTPLEFKLLVVLARHAGKVLTHRQLLREVWGPGSEGQAHNVRVFMAQLRRKIEKDAAQPRYLLTEQGVGYRLAGE